MQLIILIVYYRVNLTHQFNWSIYCVSCCQQTTTHFIYKNRPLSNLPTNNFICLSTENF